MKKILLALLLAFIPFTASAITVPWNKNVTGKIFPPLVSDYVGIGTTTPYAPLSVVGETVSSYFSATSSTATSTFAGFLSTARLHITGNATNTSAIGWNITSGCYAINGTCISGSSSSVTNTNDWQKETNFNALALTPTTTIPVWFKGELYASSTAYFTGNVGIGTTTPSRILSIESPAATFGALEIFRTSAAGFWRIGISGGNLIFQANDSVNTLTLSNDAKLGINDITPNYALDVTGEARFTGVADALYFNATSSTATSTFGGFITAQRAHFSGSATNTASQGWNITSGCFAVNGTCIGGGGGASALDDLTDVTITSAALGDMIQYNGSAWVDIATSTLFSNSSQLSSWLSDETGTGAFVLATSPSLTTPSVATSLTVTDDDWIGLGASAGRLIWDDQTTDVIYTGNAVFGVGSSSPAKTFGVTGESWVSATSTTYGLQVIGTQTGTTTALYMYSKTTGFGAEMIMEDEGGGACTRITTSAGTVKAAVVTCPVEI